MPSPPPKNSIPQNVTTTCLINNDHYTNVPGSMKRVNHLNEPKTTKRVYHFYWKTYIPHRADYTRIVAENWRSPILRWCLADYEGSIRVLNLRFGLKTKPSRSNIPFPTWRNLTFHTPVLSPPLAD